MPNITIVVPGDFLTRPAVARAIANLALALGGHDGQQGAPVVAAVAASTSVDVVPYAAAPRVDEAPTRVVPADDRLRARWNTYAAGLTDNARKFLALLEKRGRLTILEAVQIFDLPGKAVGGIVGPIGRWTPKHGFDVPFTAHETERGVRYWIWTGVADASATKPAPALATADAATGAAAPADDALRARWDNHVAGLADNARRFLALLEKRGRLVQEEAVEQLGLPGGKALGGVVGSLGRWTPVAGFKVPYAAEGDRGTRSWVWTGVAAA